MRIIQTILLIFFVALISVTLLPKLEIFFSLPKLILVISLLFLFYNEFKKGLIWASLGGLFLDFLSPGLPYNILFTTVIFLLAWLLIQRIFESSNIYLFLIFCFFGSLIYDYLFAIFYHLSPLSFTLLLNGLYTTFFGLIFVLVYRQLQRRIKKKFSLVHWEPQ